MSNETAAIEQCDKAQYVLRTEQLLTMSRNEREQYALEMELIEERLRPFVQLDIRVDKVWEFRKWNLGIYLDLENITFSEITLPDALLSTGILENPSAPMEEQRYLLKRIEQRNGTLVPTFGITAEF